MASSSSVYGSNPALPKKEDTYTSPLSPYAASKLAAEGYALAFQEAYGMQTIAFRFFNVYGPLQTAGHAYAAVMPAFIDAALRGEAVTVYGDGMQSRDFTHVDTVASVLADAASNGVASTAPVNLALGTNTTLLEVLEALESVMGQRLRRVYRAPRKGDIRASQADTTRLRRLFPEVASVPLQEGLRRTVDWYSTLPTYAWRGKN